MVTIAKLRSLEDERFFAVLDVALDVQAELDFGTDPILIPLKRDVVRYEILFPVNANNMANRYCELRWKAAEFLQREGYLSEVRWIDTGEHRWRSLVRVVVTDASAFHRLVVSLTEEEERRQPGSSSADLPRSMAVSSGYRSATAPYVFRAPCGSLMTLLEEQEPSGGPAFVV